MSSSKEPNSSKNSDKTGSEDQAETPEEQIDEARPETSGEDALAESEAKDLTSDIDVASDEKPEEGAATSEDDPPSEETRAEDASSSDEEPGKEDPEALAETSDEDRSGDDDSLAEEGSASGDDTPPDSTADNPTPDSEPEPASSEPINPFAPPPPPKVVEKIVERRGGFFPMLLGGAAAAVVGFGVARYDSGNWPFGGDDTFREDTTAAIEKQGADLGALTSQLETAVADANAGLSGLSDELSATAATLTETRQDVGAVGERVGALESLPDTLAALDERLTALAKKPIADTVSREAIKAYEDELERLRATMVEQRKSIEETIAAEKAKMERIAEEATQMEERALAEARLAAARSAMTRVLSALNTGDVFDVALGELGDNIDEPVPEALSSVAGEGVSTQAALRESFPDLAREALRQVREEAPAAEGDEGGIGGILEKMFEVRSVEPREGEGADAVLSRAEAAVRNGDLAAALSEITALPDVAKGALEQWIADANARLAALTAAQDIAQRLNQK